MGTKGGHQAYRSIPSLVALGNAAGKNLWICVPFGANDAWVTAMAAYIDANLDEDLHCYVEYSNEIWNGQFKQYKQNDAAAKAEVAAGENTLNDGGRDTNVPEDIMSATSRNVWKGSHGLRSSSSLSGADGPHRSRSRASSCVPGTHAPGASSNSSAARRSARPSARRPPAPAPPAAAAT